MPKNKEIIQEKAYEMYHLNQQVKSMHEQLKQLENNLVELSRINESLDDFENSKETEMFSHLGGGVFVKAEVKNKDKILVNVGGNILINKNIKDAKKIISNQGDETKGVIEKLGSEIYMFVERVAILEKELQEKSEE